MEIDKVYIFYSEEWILMDMSPDRHFQISWAFYSWCKYFARWHRSRSLQYIIVQIHWCWHSRWEYLQGIALGKIRILGCIFHKKWSWHNSHSWHWASYKVHMLIRFSSRDRGNFTDSCSWKSIWILIRGHMMYSCLLIFSRFCIERRMDRRLWFRVDKRLGVNMSLYTCYCTVSMWNYNLYTCQRRFHTSHNLYCKVNSFQWRCQQQLFQQGKCVCMCFAKRNMFTDMRDKMLSLYKFYMVIDISHRLEVFVWDLGTSDPDIAIHIAAEWSISHQDTWRL